jgi:peptidoglycan/LPS O-acetylase OafA/YrhL
MILNSKTDSAQPKEKPVRRVGTFTLGVFLVVLGLCLLGYYFIPGFPIELVQKLSPLMLVGMGAEVLYFSSKPGRCRMDFASVLLCLALMVGCFVLAFVPLACDRAAQWEQNRCTISVEQKV